MTWRPEYIPSGHARVGFSQPNAVRIPANVEIRQAHEPCGYCGVRPDVPCKHKREAA